MEYCPPLSSSGGMNGRFGKSSSPHRISSPEKIYGGIHRHKDAFSSKAHSVVGKIELSWRNVNVYTQPTSGIFSKMKKPKMQILQDVSGSAAPGEILAIMGSSGAGKTTLLNVLTNRNKGKLEITGSVYANDQPIGKSLISLSAYVQQDDLMFPTLTVREHLRFQAQLRMGKNITYKEKTQRVEEVINEFGLSKCADTIIGQTSLAGASKGISGGQRKRVAIASEYLTNPLLMFLDEPTSGLDSFMAESVLRTVKTLAESGKSVICTIHQPSSEIFELIDRLLLMAEGRVAFLGSRAEAFEFFSLQGLECPIHYNPADFFVHSMAIKPGEEERCKQRVKKICDAFETSPLNVYTRPRTSSQSMKEKTEAFAGRSMYKSTWLVQFSTLYQRALLAIRRNLPLSVIALFQCIVISIVVGLLYLNTEYDTRGANNINGAIFLTLMQCTFPYIFPVINNFTPELGIYRREHWNGMYRSDTYFLSKVAAELPLYLLLPSVFGTIVYWMIGMNPDPVRYLIFISVCALVANTSLSAGYIMSCACSSVQSALALTPPLILPLLLFGGIFLNAGSIPAYFVWLKYLSWFNYSYELLIINQWQNIGNLTDCNPGSCINGPMLIESLSYSEDNVAFDYGMLAVLLVGYRIIAYIILAVKSRSKE